MKVVINDDFGGFGLSAKAQKRYLELKGKPAYFYKQIFGRSISGTKYERIDNIDDTGGLFVYCTTRDQCQTLSSFPSDCFHASNINRADPILVQVVEELGRYANGPYAHLAVVDIENGRWFKIDEYDGYESIQYRDVDEEWILAQ